jgi:hypothetical protein
MSHAIPPAILDAALALSPEARAELADILLESLPIDPSFTTEIAELAEGRIDEYDRKQLPSRNKNSRNGARRSLTNSFGV